jgi:hypothetical protein
MQDDPEVKISFGERESFGSEPYRKEKVRIEWLKADGTPAKPPEVYSREQLEAKIRKLEEASLPVPPEYRDALAKFPPP